MSLIFQESDCAHSAALLHDTVLFSRATNSCIHPCQVRHVRSSTHACLGICLWKHSIGLVFVWGASHASFSGQIEFRNDPEPYTSFLFQYQSISSHMDPFQINVNDRCTIENPKNLISARHSFFSLKIVQTRLHKSLVCWNSKF